MLVNGRSSRAATTPPMASADPYLWRTFNVLLRLLGLGATFAGLSAFVGFGLGMPAPAGAPPSLSWPSLLTGGLVALLGLGFLMLPAFRPDLGDVKFVRNPLRPLLGPSRRTWWTGDPTP